LTVNDKNIIQHRRNKEKLTAKRNKKEKKGETVYANMY
jgi:hypothetical protein